MSIQRLRQDSQNAGFCGKFWRSGVFTLEASVLIPLATLMTAVLILLLFAEHNQVWYTCAAYEAAMLGNEYTVDGSGQEKAVERGELRISEQTMPGTAPALSVSSDSSGTCVSFSGQNYRMDNALFTGSFSVEAEADMKRITPVSLLYWKYSLQNLKDE